MVVLGQHNPVGFEHQRVAVVAIGLASLATSVIAASTFGYSAASSSSIVRSASGRLKDSGVLCMGFNIY